ncbi:metabotropic glutamate receptor 3-like [Dendronephthya gigantea]|uniref:metabotropic glutamate receptor 3-like n=1 Tax=Dendronephthya gigantea TaxID=151771 RepID=UPI00106D9273|nr:metabotropic glutamate receptor 3-like [Dendronephthya gigantea]
MFTKASAFYLLTNIIIIYGSSDVMKHGDVIIGQLLPMHQSSGNPRCKVPDLTSIIKFEALVYATNRLTKEMDLKVGYHLIDSCSKTEPRAKIKFAVQKWFKDGQNASRIPIAIITDISDREGFYSFASERQSQGKKMPLISLKHPGKLWNSYSMNPQNGFVQRGVFGLVRHLDWNILDIVKDDNDNGFEKFKKINKAGSICLLNELSFNGDKLTWLKRGRKTSPVAVLFSKDDTSSDVIDQLPNYNLSDWNILLGHEVSQGKGRWATNMAGVVGIRRNYGNLMDFEKHLKTSKLFKSAVTKRFCSNQTAEVCAGHKDKFIDQNIHHGASVIDAVYAIIKSRQTGSNRSSETSLTGIRVTSDTGEVVSFDTDDMTRNYFSYDVLNFRGNRFMKVGKIQFGPSMKVTLSDQIFWRNQSPHGRCSADCKPGTWREIWGEAKQCCWDCRPCVPGTVSSYANETSCVKCPIGTKPTSDQTKCQPPYIDYLKWHDPFSLVMIFLHAFTICFLVYAVNIFVKKANTPVFQRSKSASLPLLLSLFVTFVLPILLLVKPTQSSCGAYNAIFMFSLGIPLTFLIARSHVVLNYCYGDDGELKRKWFHCSPQTVISFALIILQLIVVVIVLTVAPPKVQTFTSPGSDVEYIECTSHSRPEFLPLVFFILVLIMAFNILHMNEESSPLNQNEVKFVSFGIYLMYSILFAYFVAVFGINGKKKIRVLCAMAYLFGANFLATIFLPKIYVIMFQPEKNLPDLSHLLKDENGNQERLAHRECVESPLLGLQAGPYDRTEV